MSGTTDQISEAIADFISEQKLDTPEKMQQALNSPVGTEFKNALLNNVILSVMKEEQLHQAIRIHLEQMQLKELRNNHADEKIDEPKIIEEINRDAGMPRESSQQEEKDNLSDKLKQSEDFAQLQNIINQHSEAFSNFEKSAKESLYNSVDDILGKDGLNIDLSKLSSEDKQELDQAKQRILDAPSAPDVMKVLESNDIKPPAEEFLPKRGLLDEIRLLGAAKLAADKTNSGKSIKELVNEVEKNSAIKDIGQRYEMVAEAAKNGLSEGISTILNNGTRALSQDTANKHAGNRSYLQAIVDFKSTDELKAAADQIPSPPPPPPCGPSYQNYHSGSSYSTENKDTATPNSPDFKSLKESASEMKNKSPKPKAETPAPEPEPDSDFKPSGP